MARNSQPVGHEPTIEQIVDQSTEQIRRNLELGKYARASLLLRALVPLQSIPRGAVWRTSPRIADALPIGHMLFPELTYLYELFVPCVDRAHCEHPDWHLVQGELEKWAARCANAPLIRTGREKSRVRQMAYRRKFKPSSG